MSFLRLDVVGTVVGSCAQFCKHLCLVVVGSCGFSFACCAGRL
jgi:hypothetical protein